MLSHIMLCGNPHGSWIEFINTMVSIVPVKWIHDGVVVNLVSINLAFNRKASMKFRKHGADFSNSDVRGEKAI